PRFGAHPYEKPTTSIAARELPIAPAMRRMAAHPGLPTIIRPGSAARPRAAFPDDDATQHPTRRDPHAR
ncbi:hypothetical protein M3665_25455, partial [Bacillus licheniformis]|nr:hypothetical protein [Bacillus licheniformis]